MKRPNALEIYEKSWHQIRQPAGIIWVAHCLPCLGAATKFVVIARSGDVAYAPTPSAALATRS